GDARGGRVCRRRSPRPRTRAARSARAPIRDRPPRRRARAPRGTVSPFRGVVRGRPHTGRRRRQMTPRTEIGIPTVVRVKPGALDRLGIYLARQGHRRVVLVVSEGLLPDLVKRAEESLARNGAEVVDRVEAPDASFEEVAVVLAGLAGDRQAVIGLG